MGLFDSVTSAVNRGTAAAGRTSRTARLKIQAGEIAKQRRELVAQLGASLYEEVRDRPEFREGREELLDGIAAIDSQREQIEAEIAELEAEAEAAQIAARIYTCPRCGMRVSETHSFCSGCGLSIAEVRAAACADAAAGVAGTGVTCAACGAPMAQDDLFCMTCGAKRGVEEGESSSPEAPTT